MFVFRRDGACHQPADTIALLGRFGGWGVQTSRSTRGKSMKLLCEWHWSNQYNGKLPIDSAKQDKEEVKLENGSRNLKHIVPYLLRATVCTVLY